MEFILCVKKGVQTQHGEPLNANQRKTVCHISDYMFRANLTASTEHFPTPPADEANKVYERQSIKSTKPQHHQPTSSTHLIYKQRGGTTVHTIQAPLRRPGSLTVVGKETRYLAGDPVTGQQCG